MDTTQVQVIVALITALINTAGGTYEDWALLFGFGHRFDAATQDQLAAAYGDQFEKPAVPFTPIADDPSDDTSNEEPTVGEVL